MRNMPSGNIPTLDAAYSEDGRASLMRFTMLRNQYYAGPGEQAFIAGKEVVICEPVSAPPSWWPEQTDPAAALKAYRAAGRHLEDRAEQSASQKGSSRPQKIDLKREARELSEARQKVQEQERRAAELEAEEIAEEERFQARLREYQQEILKQAAGDLFELKWETPEGPRSAMVPRAPFECQILKRTSLRDLAAPWKPVCPQGLKMMMDDPYHTDWMVGAGLFDFAEWYEVNSPLNRAAWEAGREIQKRLGSFQCAVLHDPGALGEIFGMAVAPGTETDCAAILVLPNLDPKYLEDMCRPNIRAIITGAGGAAAHLAQVAMERQIPIVRVEGDVEKYPVGNFYTIYPQQGRIELDT